MAGKLLEGAKKKTKQTHKNQPKNDVGRGHCSLCPLLYTQLTFVHPALLPILKSWSSSSVHGDKLFQLLMQAGKTAPSDLCCPNQTECNVQCILNFVSDALAGSREENWESPSISIYIIYIMYYVLYII